MKKVKSFLLNASILLRSERSPQNFSYQKMFPFYGYKL